jgi:hypothetical protein
MATFAGKGKFNEDGQFDGFVRRLLSSPAGSNCILVRQESITNVLGVALTPSSYEEQDWRTKAGTTVSSPFAETSAYFGNPKLVSMIRLNAAAAGFDLAGFC